MSFSDTKSCRKCGIEKPLVAFFKGQTYCKPCFDTVYKNGYQQDLRKRFLDNDNNVGVCNCGLYYTFKKHSRTGKVISIKNRCAKCEKR
jgi:hypothetical protein